MATQSLVRGFLFVAAGTLLLQPTFRQTGGDTPPSIIAPVAAPPPRPVLVTGKVQLEDKSVLPPRAVIEWLCNRHERSEVPCVPEKKQPVPQIPLARIQKLSVHLPPGATICKSGYLPA